jgi:cytosine/adenosine deaminase-related metal-dependent hydrolase
MRWVNSRIGPEKLPFSYAWKTLMKDGIHVSGGSDAPIEHPSPLRGIFDCIYRSNVRRKKENESLEVFRNEECLSLEEAIWIYTMEGSYACNAENKLGNLKEGYIADLIAVDPECLVDNALLHDLQPDLVIVGGKVELAKRHKSFRVMKGNIRWTPTESVVYLDNLDQAGVYVQGKGSNYERAVLCTDLVQTGYCSCQMKYCWEKFDG